MKKPMLILLLVLLAGTAALGLLSRMEEAPLPSAADAAPTAVPAEPTPEPTPEAVGRRMPRDVWWTQQGTQVVLYGC